jgi:hypothetical protein
MQKWGMLGVELHQQTVLDITEWETRFKKDLIGAEHGATGYNPSTQNAEARESQV